MQLEKIILEAKDLFESVSGQASPFGAFLISVMGHKASLISNPASGQYFAAGEWLFRVQPIPQGMNHLKDPQKRTEFIQEFQGYADRLERLGSYALQLTQSAGQNLPREYKVILDDRSA
jgi:hypothetical protein